MQVYVVCLVLLCAPAAFGIIDGRAFDQLAKYQDECIKETGTSASDVEYTIAYQRFSDDGRMDKFAECMLKQINILKSDGSVNEDSASYERNLVTDDPESLDKVKKCTQLQGANHLERARKIINCVINSNVYVLDNRPKWAKKPSTK